MKKQIALIYPIVILLAWSSAFAQTSTNDGEEHSNRMSEPAKTEATTGERKTEKSQAFSSATITATVSDNIVRIASAGEVVQTRLQIYASAGESVYDSGARQGGVVDWRLSDAPQALANGTYLCVVTIKALNNQSSQKLGALTVENNQLVIKRASEGELTPVLFNALVAARQTQKINLTETADGLTVLRDGRERAVTVAAHDGESGQVTSTKGALTFRTGNFFSGREREQMRITEDGRVGINTTNPQATLDVAGTIQTRDGIRFADGTVLKTAAGIENTSRFKDSGKRETAEITAPSAVGTGTQNRIAKWGETGGAGTLVDSQITELGGNLGIGTTTPIGRLHLVDTVGSETTGDNTFRIESTAGTVGPSFRFKSFQGADYIMTATGSGNFGGAGAFRIYDFTGAATRFFIAPTTGNIGIGTTVPAQKLDVAGNLKLTGTGNGVIFPDGSKLTSANTTGTPSGINIVNAINDPATSVKINDDRLASSFVKFVPGAEQLSVGDANGTAPMINLRGGSTCCSGPGGHTPAWFKVFQNGSFVATGNLGIGVSPMQGKGYRTSWDSYKGAFRSGYADNEWDDATVGFFSWAGGSNSTAEGLYALAFGDTNFARSTSSIAFGSGNEVKGAAGFAAGAGNRVCDTYGVAFGNNARSGGPLINGKCDPDTFNIRGLAAVAIGYNVTADQDHTTAMGKFASNNGFQGTFIWSDGLAQASADTFRNTANNEFALRATGGFRFRTNLTGTTGCNLPAGSGVFNCTSSRSTKENFSLVQGSDVLSRLRKIPVSSWNYISEGRNIRHLGPMAEDFHSQFNLGVGNASIGVQDLAGVTLAAVKELDAQLQQKTETVEKLQAEVNQLRATQTALEKRLEALERNAQKQNK